MESNNIVNPNIARQNVQGGTSTDGNSPTTPGSKKDGSNIGLNGSKSLAEDFDSFLNLLTSQLKNQDPLDPMKSQEFTNQLVKFSEVEQTIKTNDKLDELLALQGDSKTNAALSMIGKNVEAEANQFRLTGDAAKISYELENDAQNATIQIANSDGNVVKSLNVSPQAGEHTVTWNGESNDGQDMDDGVYTMQLLAVDSQNQTVKGSTFAHNAVTGFEERDGTVQLDLGGFEVPMDKVKAVRADDDA